MDTLGYLFAFAGAALLAWRIWPRSARLSFPPQDFAWPKVSVIVPARNEEAVLPKLLRSLAQLDYPDYEVIVVDDRSEDKTAEIARAFPFVRLVSGQERAEDWKGKQWACHQGALQAQGSFLVFTDADTEHYPDSLRRAVWGLFESKAQGASVLPFHACTSFWEKLCGPFHVLLLAGTAPYTKGRLGQVFAIGQYLIFEREAYQQMGGHEVVRDKIAEDIALANQVMKSGFHWAVLKGRPYFEVRMYESLSAFIAGWRRSFRAGMQDSVPWAPLEMTAFFAALAGAGHPFQVAGLLLGLGSWIVVARAQASLGRFSLWGIVFAPFALGLFCWVTLLASYDRLLKRPTLWKNRAYAAS